MKKNQRKNQYQNQNLKNTAQKVNQHEVNPIGATLDEQNDNNNQKGSNESHTE